MGLPIQADRDINRPRRPPQNLANAPSWGQGSEVRGRGEREREDGPKRERKETGSVGGAGADADLSYLSLTRRQGIPPSVHIGRDVERPRGGSQSPRASERQRDPGQGPAPEPERSEQSSDSVGEAQKQPRDVGNARRTTLNTWVTEEG